jgi:hypothetical protein
MHALIRAAAVPFRRIVPLLSLAPLLLLAACTTRSLGTTSRPVTSVAQAHGMTHHGFVDGELIVSFTPDGERAVTPMVGKAAGPLRFGVPSLDRLNVKYRASSLTAVEGARGSYVLKLSPDANVMRAADEYGRDPLISGAAPNYLLRIQRPAEAPGQVRTDVKPK